MWIAILVTVVVASAIIGMLEVRDNRRIERTHKALDEYAAAMQEIYNPPTPTDLEVHITDWGEDHDEDRWRWTIWDPDFDFASSRVEGGLVPYAAGNAPRRHEAVHQAVAWIKGWAFDHNGWTGTIRIMDDNFDLTVDSEELL